MSYRSAQDGTEQKQHRWHILHSAAGRMAIWSPLHLQSKQIRKETPNKRAKNFTKDHQKNWYKGIPNQRSGEKLTGKTNNKKENSKPLTTVRELFVTRVDVLGFGHYFPIFQHSKSGVNFIYYSFMRPMCIFHENLLSICQVTVEIGVKRRQDLTWVWIYWKGNTKKPRSKNIQTKQKLT